MVSDLAKDSRLLFLLAFTLLLILDTASSQSMLVPRIETAKCVTQELVDAGVECYLFFGQEDRDDPNGTIVELQAVGHWNDNACRRKLIGDFIDEPYAKVDDSCKNNLALASWVLE